MTTPRRSRDETRALMLAAGVEVLMRDGISLGASTFRYADAFELLQDEHGIKVTRGSVHERIWSSQEAWQLDVLTACIVENVEGRRSAVTAAVMERLAEMPLVTETDRLNVLAETCRVGSLVFLQTVEENPTYRLFPIVIAAWKASANNLPEFDKLGLMLSEVQRKASLNVQEGMDALVELAHLEPHPSGGLTLEAAVRAYCVNSTALAYSHTIRSRHDPALLETIEARGPDGVQRQWNHLGLSLWLIARGLFRTRALDQEDVST